MRLQEVLQAGIKMYRCPICNNDTLEPGEVIEYFKVSPDFCDICGYRESNGTEAYPDESDYINKCWELQVAPYPSLEMNDR